MTTPQIAFVTDPLENFSPIAETTFYIMLEISRRKWPCYAVELKDLFAEGPKVFGLAKKIQVTRIKNKFGYKILGQKKCDLAKMDAIFLRKDPPVDLNYIDHLHLLKNIQGQTFFVNCPEAILRSNEKLSILNFPHFIAPTIVSQNLNVLHGFVKKQQRVILKPLNLSGGQGIVQVTDGDPSLLSILEIVTQNESRYVMAQKFIPGIKNGDKRILLLGGQVLGAFLRIPKKNDFRGNLHSGARFINAELTPKEQKIVNVLTPHFKKTGSYFVGLDVIDGYLTEINVTSPMGLHEINTLEKTQTEKIVVDWLQNALRAENFRSKSIKPAF